MTVEVGIAYISQDVERCRWNQQYHWRLSDLALAALDLGLAFANALYLGEGSEEPEGRASSNLDPQKSQDPLLRPVVDGETEQNTAMKKRRKSAASGRINTPYVKRIGKPWRRQIDFTRSLNSGAQVEFTPLRR